MDEQDSQHREKKREEGSEVRVSSFSTSAQLEAVLFYKGEPTSFNELSGILQLPVDEITKGLQQLQISLKRRGLALILENETAALGTVSQASELIARIRKKEITGDLGKAALECLTIILYRGPIARADVDYIRGVNSQFILRRLSIRGLIEKETDKENLRRNLYRPSMKLLSHLGISKLNDLPEYEKVEDEFRGMNENEEVLFGSSELHPQDKPSYNDQNEAFE